MRFSFGGWLGPALGKKEAIWLAHREKGGSAATSLNRGTMGKEEEEAKGGKRMVSGQLKDRQEPYCRLFFRQANTPG